MYLDPGFGSMIIQIILGIVAGGGALLFMLRRKVAKLFGKELPQPDLDADELDDENDDYDDDEEIEEADDDDDE